MTRVLLALAAAFLLAMPFLADAVGSPALLALATRILIYAIAAASLNFILGYGGMVSFGHAAFFGVGAYTVGILFSHHASGIPLWGFIPGANQLLITLPAAVLLAGIAAAAIGALSLRTGGVQFIMITLAFAQMMIFFFVALKSYGGEDGIIIRRSNEFLGLNMRDRTTLYYVILGIAALFFAGAVALAGLPPLSGFAGKLLILQAARDHAATVWPVTLVTSLLMILGFAAAGSTLFWKAHATLRDPGPEPPATAALPFVAVFGLTFCLVALTVLAGPVLRVLDATAADLYAPAPYIAANALPAQD